MVRREEKYGIKEQRGEVRNERVQERREQKCRMKEQRREEKRSTE